MSSSMLINVLCFVLFVMVACRNQSKRTMKRKAAKNVLKVRREGLNAIVEGISEYHKEPSELTDSI